MSTLGCVANEAAYREGAEWVDQMIAYVDDNHKFLRDYVAKNMPTVGYNDSEGTYLTWLDFSKTMNSVGAAEMAAERSMTPEDYFQDWLVMNSGVYLNAGSPYGKGGSGNMRFNLGSSRVVVKEALDHLAKAVNNV